MNQLSLNLKLLRESIFSEVGFQTGLDREQTFPAWIRRTLRVYFYFSKEGSVWICANREHLELVICSDFIRMFSGLHSLNHHVILVRNEKKQNWLVVSCRVVEDATQFWRVFCIYYLLIVGLRPTIINWVFFFSNNKKNLLK